MIKLIPRVFKCLSKKSLNKLIKLQIVTVLLAFLNVASALLITPFIMLISGKDLNINNIFFQNVFNFLKSFDSNNLLLFITIIFVGFYIFSIILTLLLSFLNINWIQEINLIFQKNLYSFYINKDWLFHSNISSQGIISKIHTDTQRLTNTVILPFINLISNLFISLTIVSAIFFVDFAVALFTVSIFILFYSFFYFFFKNKLREAGDTMTKTYPNYFKSIFEGFTSIKDVILFDKKNFYKDFFYSNANKIKKISIIQSFLVQIPRGIIEIIFFTLLILFILILLKIYEYEFVEIGALIAFYGICAIKVIPAFQKIFNSLASIDSNISSFYNIEEDLINAKQIHLTNNQKEISQKINFQKEIEINDVTFRYPSKIKAGVFNVNMKIPFGSKIGIVGKTGSGKSTLLDLILGFINPQSGEILVDKLNLNNKNLKSWQKNISYVPQNFYIYEGTVKSNVAFALNEKAIETNKITKSLELAELKEFIGNVNLDVGENGKKLSGGQKQRIGIARAIYKNTELLVLDEATSALDTITEKKIIKNLDNNKKIKTLIIVSHRFESLEMCDKIYFIEEGKVEELKNFNDLISKYKNK